MGWRETFSGYVDAVADYLFGRDFDEVRQGTRAKPTPQQTALATAVERAHREWVTARSFFDNVSDPRLVDYAIYSIGAAEKRYMFLLDEARRQGLRVDPLRDT